MVVKLKQNENRGEIVSTKVSLKDLPNKIYGDLTEFGDTVIRSYEELGSSVGVLLNGLKGSGKTLLANYMCTKVSDVFIISNAIEGSDLTSYLLKETNPSSQTVVFIDEFEKVYNDIYIQESLLPLLDGVLGLNILFIFTSNTKSVSQFMLNRTGRIRYYRYFDGLDSETIDEVIDENLKSPEYEDKLRETINRLGKISFDNLKGLITELNMNKGKDYYEVVKYLNISAESVDFKVSIIRNNKRHTSKINFHPLSRANFKIHYKTGDWDWDFIDIDLNEDIISNNGSTIRVNKSSGDLVIFERVEAKEASLYHLLRI